jgi:hypothetical protein
MHQRSPKQASMQMVAVYNGFHNPAQKYGKRIFYQNKLEGGSEYISFSKAHA